MEIFYRLLFGHLLADFTFQTNYIAELKRRKFIGLLVHVIIHPICYTVLTWPFIHETWRVYGGISLSGVSCIVIATIVHFLEDWFRVTAVNHGWRDNTFFYLWDQAVHLVALWFLAPIGRPGPVESWPIIGSLVVLVTHCATVTVWFIEKDIYGRDYPETEEKYLSIMHRLVVWFSFSLPAPWWYIVVIVVIGSFARHVWTRRVDFSWTSVIMGNLIAVSCGFFSRFVLNFHF